MYEEIEEYDEMLPEMNGLLLEGDPNYIHIQWFVEDPDPGNPNMMTFLGPQPKTTYVRDGKQYVCSFWSQIGKN